MALFGKKKKIEEKVSETKVEAVKKSTKKVNKPTTQIGKTSKVLKDLSFVIKRPRITEKGAIIADNNVYTFDVHQDATKIQVAEAVKTIYKVTPLKVNILTLKAKSKRSRRTGKIGSKAGGRKAYVFLKKGDKIEFV